MHERAEELCLYRPSFRSRDRALTRSGVPGISRVDDRAVYNYGGPFAIV